MQEVLEFVKLALRPCYSLAFAVTAIVILAIPLPDVLLLDDVRKEYGKWLGIVAVFSSVVWLIEAAIVTGKTAFASHKKRSERRAKLAQLDSLSDDELLLLGTAVASGRQTVLWKPGFSAVPSLIHKGLLEATDTTVADPYKSRAFVVPRDVWDHIRKPTVRIKERALLANPDKQQLLTSKEH